jgi:hypothetical protein
VTSGPNIAPGVTWADRMRAASYGRMGREATARRTPEIFVIDHPGRTIAKLRTSMPPAILATRKACHEGMRAAGIPAK